LNEKSFILLGCNLPVYSVLTHQRCSLQQLQASFINIPYPGPICLKERIIIEIQLKFIEKQ